MKLLFDLFPVLLFFIAFKMADIYVATTVAIIATIGQIAWVWLRHRRVEPMQWVSLVIVGVFGGMTLALHDETFIKWKPTILYWAFAVALFASARFFGKNLIQKMLSEQMQLPDHVWAKLNLSWMGFFIFMGIANLLVAFNFSTDDWVNFKLFGGMGLMLVFVVAQGLLLSKYIEEKP